MTKAPDRPAAESASELKARALRYLARREHSRLELERKLARHAGSESLLQGVLSELEGRKLLSNHRFAETRAHVLARKYGAARIRQELKSKGISSEIAARVAPSDDLERARTILARKYRQPPHDRKEQAKRMRFLQSRGFSYDTIRSVMRIDESE